MKGLTRTIKWFTAAVLLVAMSAVPALADLKVAKPKTTPATDKNTAVPAVPRAIPDLVPYWKFDPPRSSLFDINKLTFSGDLRVRPEFRTNSTFGDSKRNDFYVQQWMRFGINYSISPDVEVFFQPQWSKNWGANNLNGTGVQSDNGNCGANICANDPFNVAAGQSFFARQAFVLIRNIGVENLSLKLGRQLIVFGNHRLFGHFDWANTGFSHDAITAQYASKNFNFNAGWARTADKDFFNLGGGGQTSEFGVVPPGVTGPQGNANTDASNDADLFFARFTLKPIKGLSIEPMWIYFINGAPSGPGAFGGASTTNAHAPNQNRHTVGSRFAFKRGIFDMNAEGYWQFGSMGVTPGNSSRNLRINAYAGAVQVGFTLPVPMQPRIGGEVNIASGDGNATTCTNANPAGCGGHANTFEQFYPTNHILFGYMDLFAWRNMVSYGGNFQLRPTKNSHFEIWGNIFRRQTAGDHWYRAAQNAYFNGAGGTSKNLGQEIDVIYTIFFKDNKVGWQIGYGHFFPGTFVEQATGNNSPPGQDWGYTQVHVNF